MEDTEGPRLPPGIELAWGVREAPTRGPKRGLSLERIVAAGIAVAQADGLGAVSMSRVAAEAGAATMSLYRYVSAKDDLLELMVDTALGSPPAAAPGQDWRAGLRRWAEGVRTAYRAHPWALRVPITGPPLGPNNARWLENALAALAGTPLTEQQKVSTALLLSGFVRNEETLLLDFMESGKQLEMTYGRALARVADPREFPELTTVIASGVFDDEPDDLGAEFEFGLGTILDGVAVMIAAASPGPG